MKGDEGRSMAAPLPAPPDTVLLSNSRWGPLHTSPPSHTHQPSPRPASDKFPKPYEVSSSSSCPGLDARQGEVSLRGSTGSWEFGQTGGQGQVPQLLPACLILSAP